MLESKKIHLLGDKQTFISYYVTSCYIILHYIRLYHAMLYNVTCYDYLVILQYYILLKDMIYLSMFLSCFASYISSSTLTTTKSLPQLLMNTYLTLLKCIIFIHLNKLAFVETTTLLIISSLYKSLLKKLRKFIIALFTFVKSLILSSYIYSKLENLKIPKDSIPLIMILYEQVVDQI